MIQKNWQDLIKPEKVEFKAEGKTIATVIAEPLERGFGLTLGNALRRVLLSSLRGAAVTALQIDGVLHEFSSIPGVREDVTDIVLNIKEIAIRMEGDGPKRMVVRKQGPGTVTAGDIQTVGDVEILNPHHVICQFHADFSAFIELANPAPDHRRRRAATAPAPRWSAPRDPTSVPGDQPETRFRPHRDDR